MNKQQFTETNERIGREQFQTFTNQQPNWNINKFAKKRYAKYDVSYMTGTTQDFVIGEIKYRPTYNYDAYSDWLLEQEKYESLQELKKEMHAKHPNKKIYVHYIMFYKDKPNIPRIWDITHLMQEFTLTILPANSNTLDPNQYNKPAIKLHNNDTINL